MQRQIEELMCGLLNSTLLCMEERKKRKQKKKNTYIYSYVISVVYLSYKLEHQDACGGGWGGRRYRVNKLNSAISDALPFCLAAIIALNSKLAAR